jgi:hypothetical protein
VAQLQQKHGLHIGQNFHQLLIAPRFSKCKPALCEALLFPFGNRAETKQQSACGKQQRLR